jgi:hypothetical protein
MMLRSSIHLVFGLVLAGLPAHAFEGRNILWVNTYPTTLNNPGSYLLANSPLVPPGTPVVIDITADDVTLDLNGETITEPGSLGVLIHVTGRNVVVRNGRLVGGAIGVHSLGSNASMQAQFIHALDQAEAGIKIQNAAVAEVTGCRIERYNLLGTPSGGGILTLSTLVSRIASNTLLDGRVSAIFANASSSHVHHNIVDRMESPGDGVVVSTSTALVVNNSVKSLKDGVGILINADPALVKENDVRSVSKVGISLSGDGGRVAQNVVTSVGVGGSLSGDGILVSGSYNLVEDNLSEKNLGCGLVFQSFALGNGYRDNMLRNNAGSCVLGVNDLGTGNTNAGGNL